MRKRRMGFLFLAFLLAIGFSLVFMGCGGGGGSSTGTTAVTTTVPPTPPADPNVINQNGIRNDVQTYIDSAYPNSAKKRAALTQYAKSLQTAYTKVTTETEARNAEPQIIRALSCVTMLGEASSTNAPSDKVDSLMANTPERLATQIKYENLVGSKTFTISSPGDTPASVCDFDPNSLPN